MRKQKEGIFKDLSYSVIANGTNMLISMLLVLIVPKVLGVKEYAYWQLYLFYASYVGFFHFGWADGVYLRFGGKAYEDLDKEYFHNQFCLLTLMEIIIAFTIGFLSYGFIDDRNKISVLLAVGLCCVLQLPRTFLQYILQATGRIANYARNYFLEKIVYAIIVIVALLVGVRDFRILICADLIARAVTLFLLCVECKDIVAGNIKGIFKGLRAAWENISVGIKLMLANIASLFLLGIVRWAIQNYWSVETFGKVSLSITASNLLMTFISAVSIVIYPMLKNISLENYGEIYMKMRNMLMIPVLGMLIIYYPAKVILSWWLPQYSESLTYMALLFPMCVFESKMTMLINTYLKALRKERSIMNINLAVSVITLFTTGIFVYGLGDLTMAITSLPILMGVRCCIGEIIVGQQIKISVYKDMLSEWILILVFMTVSWNIQSWWSMIIYGIVYIIYLLWKRENVIEFISLVRNKIRKRESRS